MIHYSPNSRYSAQKIADKVGNGAYFYSHFSVESDQTLWAEKIDQLILKLSKKYALDLSPRQRTYRLNTKKEPIADLIVQKRIDQEVWDFYLLITTPKSNEYNNEKRQGDLKKITRQRVSEVEFSWSRDEEEQQVALIQSYFSDHEKFKCVLKKPYLKLALGDWNAELVRLSHSTKSSKNYAPIEKSAKNYTWTWRFDEPSVQLMKKKYIELMNMLISRKDKTQGMNELALFYRELKRWAVFKGNRHQVGKVFVDAVRYHYKKTAKDFRKMDYYLALELNYLPRQSNYADSFTQYIFLRNIYEVSGEILDKSGVNDETYSDLLNQYLV